MGQNPNQVSLLAPSGSGAYESVTGKGTYDLMTNPWAERLQGELTSG